jgi:hypothetical protein
VFWQTPWLTPPSSLPIGALAAEQHAWDPKGANPEFVYSYVSVKMVPEGSSEPGTAIGVEPLTISIPT